MKTPYQESFWTKLSLSLSLLLLQFTLSAQTQWYQNQDGNGPLPNGTTAVSVQSLTASSFVACYQWAVNNDQVTWKISKSHINGTEQHTLFFSGITAQVQVKVGHHNSLYVVESDFPLGQNAEYIVYKLDTNLVIKAQQAIAFPNGFNIFNMNAVELDASDNIYFAGDGQYPNGPGFGPASFVLKTDKNLAVQWNSMDSMQTSFTRLHIDSRGNVFVIGDFYTFFPDVHITKLLPNGHRSQRMTVHTDAGRYTLLSALDDDDDLLLYGGKFIGNNSQGVFLYKVSGTSGRVIYSKTYFTAVNTQLNDFKLDERGNIFSLVSQYFGPNNQVCRISRINAYNGNIYWNQAMNFAHDSCNLFKLVMNGDDHFYVVGEKMRRNIFSKGFALRMTKNGQTDNSYVAPDSVAFLRSHWLLDGIIDRNDQLIAIGNTSDLDISTGASTYARSFAVRFGAINNGCAGNLFSEPGPPFSNFPNNPANDNRITMYPNPAQDQLMISNLDPGEYKRLGVYNMQGFLLMQQLVNSTTVRINVSGLVNGLYMLSLQSVDPAKGKNLWFSVKK